MVKKKKKKVGDPVTFVVVFQEKAVMKKAYGPIQTNVSIFQNWNTYFTIPHVCRIQ